jgi:hypothetical protein
MPSSRTPYDKGDKGKEGGRPDIKDRFVTLFRGLSKSKARRYTIEVKDAKSGAVVMFAAVDWSKTQKRAGMAKICLAAGLPHDKDFTGFRKR